jgi:CRISPR/Cas system-associated protein Cas10 (large subunit of type III CRISPR-Cas system)
MRVFVSAFGIQEYIFDITQRAASVRLRGRSARLGFVLDLCLQRLTEELGVSIHTLRNAGSRLEVEFDAPSQVMAAHIAKLQSVLDQHSREALDGQVWFTVAAGESSDTAYKDLAYRKLSPGKAALQGHGNTIWNERAFTIERQTDERRLQREERDEARALPEAVLGRLLAHRENQYVQFTDKPHPDHGPIPVLDRFIHLSAHDPGGYRLKLGQDSGSDQKLSAKRLCRYAPANPDGSLVDLNEIAKRSQGAAFLGVLKADLDNAGAVFRQCSSDDERRRLSERMEAFFTEGLERVADSKNCTDCYVVYSGGDDMFLLGPWDQLIRFALEFRNQLQQTVRSWGIQGLTLSAGFKLTQPGSAVRHLASEAETALAMAKGHRNVRTSLPAKNRIAVFERLLGWDEVSEGIRWAEEFIRAVEADQLSSGFLQRMQYYASESRRYFEDQHLDALSMIPLLHNEWERNKRSFSKELGDRLEREVLPLLRKLTSEGERMWRVIDFASRYASYAIRKLKGENEHG